jgi:putative spermidine/putrescine transport system permease protein
VNASEQPGLRLSALQGALLALVPLGFLALFFIVPLVSTIRNSAFTYVPPLQIVDRLTQANYRAFLDDPYYRSIFFTTLVTAVETTIAAAVIGFPVAYWIGRAAPLARSVALALVLLPLLVSDVIRTYGWTILLANNGILAQILALVRLPAPDVMFTDRGVVVGLVEVLLPFLVLPTVGSIAAIPVSVEEAARSLGARPVTVLLRIVLPLALPGLIVGALLVFIISLGAFVTPDLMGGPTVPVMGTLIYNQATTLNDWPFASAIGMLLLGTVLVVLLALSGLGRLWTART